MAIQPPSDIVMDVLKAADPASLEIAQAKLKSGQAASAAQRLAGTDQSFDSTLGRHLTRDLSEVKNAGKKEIPETYRKFEGMVLQSMLKSMLPDSGEIYGKGATGEIWKGMLAEQLGNAIAKQGGIGIAERLAEKGFTALENIKSVSDKNRGDRIDMATQLIGENQMRALDELLPGDHSDKTKESQKLG